MAKKMKAARSKGTEDAVINKSELIREALGKLGIDASTKVVQNYAQGKHPGLVVAQALISNIRGKLRDGDKKRERKATCRDKRTCDDPQVKQSELIQARTLADKVGGVERAKQLIDLLAKLR